MILISRTTQTVYEEIKDKITRKWVETNEWDWLIPKEKPKKKLVKRKKS